MSDYFAEKEVSDDDLNSVIKKRYHLNCHKITSKFKVRLSDDNESYSYAVKSAFVKDQLESQPFEAYDFDGSVISLLLQSNLMEILMKTVVRAQESEIELVEPKHIIATMFDEDCSDLMDFFADLRLSYKEAKDYFVEHYNQDTFIIPTEFSGILSILNDKIDISKPCEILGRDKEVESCYNLMLRRDRHNVLIISEIGYGKTALLQKIAYDIVSQACPSSFFGFTVVSLDVYALIGEIEKSLENVNNLIDLLTSRSDIIVCIEGINELVVYQEEAHVEIFHILKRLWTNSNITIIGTITPKDYNEGLANYNICLDFNPVIIPIVYPNEMYDVLHLKIKNLAEFHKVHVSKEVAKYALKIGCTFLRMNSNSLHPIVSLFDSALSTAKRLSHKNLTREDILLNCYLSYDEYDKVPKYHRWAIAIHEAGHYVTGKLCKSLANVQLLAITIIPSGNYSGGTIALEYANSMETLDYLLDYIAYLLGGQQAEKVFGIQENSGAGSDLQNATQIVFDSIESLNLLGPSHRNELYLNSVQSLKMSDETAKEMNQKACELINIATQRAFNIVSENKDIIEAIADALLQKPVMVSEEIDKVWKDTVTKRQWGCSHSLNA